MPSAPARSRTRIAPRLAGALAALSLALGAGAPAQAFSKGEEDLLKFLGIVGLGALVINMARDEDAQDAPPRPIPWANPGREAPRPAPHDVWRRLPEPVPAPRPAPAVGPRVPDLCVLDVQSRAGPSRAVSEDCLIRERFAARLPAACRFEVRGAEGKIRSVYGAACLRQNGIRVGP